MKQFIYTILIATFFVHPVFAKCKNTRVSQTEDERSVKLPFGRVNLSNRAFHPEGTVLASVVVPSTSYTFGGAHGESVLWICDKTDLGQLKFLAATNGDSRFGGEFELIPGVYGTWFDHVGLRQTLGGVELTRHWQSIPLGSYKEVGDKLHIRLSDLPTMVAELVYVDSHVPPSGWYNCGGYPSKPINNKDGLNYSCLQPASYIQLYGPGIPHDEPGEDHRDYHWDFWGADNGFGYTLWNAATLSANPTCVVHSVTPHVHFPTVTVNELEQGGSANANFSLVLDCESATVSGSGSGETAIGIQVSEGAFRAAQQLGLVRDGGVDYLVSDQYGLPGVAKGVGIALIDSEGNQRRWVGQPGTVGRGHYRGPLAGWHPVSWGSKMIGLSPPDNYLLQLDFNARLQQLPGLPIEAGKVKATAHVTVKVQ